MARDGVFRARTGRRKRWGAMASHLLILGPTASGKTATAIRIAKACGGEVVNMDSMQVYADLAVLTARPALLEMDGVAHHLFGVVDAAAPWDVALWLAAARQIAGEISARNRRVIFVGGTGLYAHALTHGLAPTPAISAPVRAAVRGEVEADPAAAWRRLAGVDPEIARRVAPADRSRIARALEVWDETGTPLSDWQAQPHPPALPPGAWEGLAIVPDRAALESRIARRFDAMLADGALEEARALWSRGLDRSLPAMKAHGMPALCDHFDGLCDIESVRRRAILDTRRYAKRQMTWLRGRAADWPRLNPDAPDATVPSAPSAHGC